MSSPDEEEAPDETAADFKGIVLSQTHIDLPARSTGSGHGTDLCIPVYHKTSSGDSNPTLQLAILQALYQA